MNNLDAIIRGISVGEVMSAMQELDMLRTKKCPDASFEIARMFCAGRKLGSLEERARAVALDGLPEVSA